MSALIFAASLSFLFVPLIILIAKRIGLQDEPNHRSLHIQPTPRGGGIAIVVAFFSGLAFQAGQPDWPLVVGFAAAGIAILGLLDDLFSLRPSVRFMTQTFLCLIALSSRGGFEEISLFGLGHWTGFSVEIFALGLLLWFINLYNFMDGSDGLAAGQSFFVAAAAGAITFLNHHEDLSQLYFLLASSTLGFLIFNWSPARIFMGDVGSCFVGFVLAFLALSGEKSGALPGFAALILNATFISDATLTLFRRLSSGQRIHQAHRSHAYQRAILKKVSHRQVATVNALIVIFWLAPLAFLATRYEAWSLAIFVAAYFPLVVMWKKLGGGQVEGQPHV